MQSFLSEVQSTGGLATYGVDPSSSLQMPQSPYAEPTFLQKKVPNTGVLLQLQQQHTVLGDPAWDNRPVSQPAMPHAAFETSSHPAVQRDILQPSLVQQHSSQSSRGMGMEALDGLPPAMLPGAGSVPQPWTISGPSPIQAYHPADGRPVMGRQASDALAQALGLMPTAGQHAASASQPWSAYPAIRAPSRQASFEGSPLSRHPSMLQRGALDPPQQSMREPSQQPGSWDPTGLRQAPVGVPVSALQPAALHNQPMGGLQQPLAAAQPPTLQQALSQTGWRGGLQQPPAALQPPTLQQISSQSYQMGGLQQPLAALQPPTPQAFQPQDYSWATQGSNVPQRVPSAEDYSAGGRGTPQWNGSGNQRGPFQAPLHDGMRAQGGPWPQPRADANGPLGPSGQPQGADTDPHISMRYPRDPFAPSPSQNDGYIQADDRYPPNMDGRDPHDRSQNRPMLRGPTAEQSYDDQHLANAGYVDSDRSRIGYRDDRPPPSWMPYSDVGPANPPFPSRPGYRDERDLHARMPYRHTAPADQPYHSQPGRQVQTAGGGAPDGGYPYRSGPDSDRRDASAMHQARPGHEQLADYDSRQMQDRRSMRHPPAMQDAYTAPHNYQRSEPRGYRPAETWPDQHRRQAPDLGVRDASSRMQNGPPMTTNSGFPFSERGGAYGNAPDDQRSRHARRPEISHDHPGGRLDNMAHQQNSIQGHRQPRNEQADHYRSHRDERFGTHPESDDLGQLSFDAWTDSEPHWSAHARAPQSYYARER